MSSNQNADLQDSSGYFPSVYYAEATVNCGLRRTWELMLNIPEWNPSFAGATTIRICGGPNSEGELVQISFVDPGGISLPPFYARTISVVPERRIAWYCYPALDDSFKTFLEFGLLEVSSGVKFSLQWYALDRVPAEALAVHRKATDATVQNLAIAFQAYCEA